MNEQQIRDAIAASEPHIAALREIWGAARYDINVHRGGSSVQFHDRESAGVITEIASSRVITDTDIHHHAKIGTIAVVALTPNPDHVPEQGEE